MNRLTVQNRPAGTRFESSPPRTLVAPVAPSERALERVDCLAAFAKRLGGPLPARQLAGREAVTTLPAPASWGPWVCQFNNETGKPQINKLKHA